ncbi:hypothetical protein [Nitratidesulfovibrio sp. HK-II]|uniref:hypothetical protein n=1 Tax=Nitratidesulfovibrio sp. HK-II TaxID=2009266 RepID=UPI0026D69C4B
MSAHPSPMVTAPAGARKTAPARPAASPCDGPVHAQRASVRTGFARTGGDGRRTRLTVVPARRVHLREVLAALRPRDRAELEALGPRGATTEAARAFALSPMRWAVLRGGRCVALFGARPYPGLSWVSGPSGPSGVAAPWLFGTPELDAEGRALARLGPLFAARMRAAWPCLVNMIHAPALAERPATARWLARCGFAVAARPAPLGRDGAPFHPFINHPLTRAIPETP